MTRKFREAKPLSRPRFGQRPPRPEIVIVCEGKVTEPEYFREFSSLYGNSLVTITTVGGCGVPTSVVDRAVEEARKRAVLSRRNKDSFETFEVWAVFDRDEHPIGQVPQAMATASKNGVCVAYSNPCFELWGLMHFSCYSKPGHHHETQSALKRVLSGYCHDDSPRIRPSVLADKYEAAISNAERAIIDRENEGRPNGDPSTTVHKLTERIKHFGRK